MTVKIRSSITVTTLLCSAALLTIGLVACKNDSSLVNDPDAGDGGPSFDGSSSPIVDSSAQPTTDSGPSTDEDSGTGGDASLAAPVIDTLKPNDAGSLTVTWENIQPDCDSVEGWRKDGLTVYAAVFTVPGTTTKNDDPGAYKNQNYTYKLRCKKGADYSPFSFELSANPQN